MKSALPKPLAEQPAMRDPALGSEYLDARTWLEHAARTGRVGPGRKRAKEPQHGSNDSDFGIPDQRQD